MVNHGNKVLFLVHFYSILNAMDLINYGISLLLLLRSLFLPFPNIVHKNLITSSSLLLFPIFFPLPLNLTLHLLKYIEERKKLRFPSLRFFISCWIKISFTGWQKKKRLISFCFFSFRELKFNFFFPFNTKIAVLWNQSNIKTQFAVLFRVNFLRKIWYFSLLFA